MARRPDPTKWPLFALRIDASADTGNVFPVGTRRPILLVARAPELDVAIEMARETLTFHHWTDATLLGTGEVNVFGEAIADTKLRAVVEYAREHGSGILVYDN
jgi:hypothetical protein